MESSKLRDQVEELLRDLGVEPPSEGVEVADDSLCAMCGLGAHFSAIENAYLRQFIECAPGDLTLADGRLAGQQHAVVAVAAVAMELALANPEWAQRLLSQLPFGREQTQFAAASIRAVFVE